MGFQKSSRKAINESRQLREASRFQSRTESKFQHGANHSSAMQLCPPTTQSPAAEHLHCGNLIDLPHPSAISAQTPTKSICNRCTGHQIIMFAKLTNGKYGQGRKDSQITTKELYYHKLRCPCHTERAHPNARCLYPGRLCKCHRCTPQASEVVKILTP